MSSRAQCPREVQSELKLYWTVIGASLGLAACLKLPLCIRLCLRRFLRQSRGTLRAKSCIAIGAIKILLSIMILIVLHPKCPHECVCHGRALCRLVLYSPDLVILAIGIRWVMRGLAFLRDVGNLEGGEVTDGGTNGGKRVDVAVSTTTKTSKRRKRRLPHQEKGQTNGQYLVYYRAT